PAIRTCRPRRPIVSRPPPAWASRPSWVTSTKSGVTPASRRTSPRWIDCAPQASPPGLPARSGRPVLMRLLEGGPNGREGFHSFGSRGEQSKDASELGQPGPLASRVPRLGVQQYLAYSQHLRLGSESLQCVPELHAGRRSPCDCG